MKLLKISSISFFALFSFIMIPQIIFAAEVSPTQKTVVLAQMNVQDAKVVSQDGSNINLSFDIVNREGAQSGVRYSVKLMQKEGKSLTSIDEYIYPEVLSIGANSTTKKNVTYVAPANLGGSYTLMISMKNYSGLPLGTATVGEIKLEATIKTVEILEETCFFKTSADREANHSVSDMVSIANSDKITLTCTIRNNGGEQALSTPVFETHYRSLYGDIAEQTGGDMSPILLGAGEEKVVTLNLPKVTIPQSYSTKIFFKTEDISSNYVLVNYTLSGLSATIQNFSLDKNAYKARETAKISFFWTSSATKKEELSAITLNADIMNENQKKCATSINQQLAGVGFVEIPVSINRNCENPKVVIELKDASGNILDQKALAFEANEEPNSIFSGKGGVVAIIIILILAIIGLVLYMKKSKKKENGNSDINGGAGSGHIEGAMLAIFFALALSFIPGGFAKADTLYISMTGVDESYTSDPYYGVIIANTSLSKSSYSYGETPLTVNSSIYYDAPGTVCANVFLHAQTSTELQSMDFGGETIICGGQELYATNDFYGSTAQSGNYSVYINGNVYLRGTSEVGVGWTLPYTVLQEATVTVTANNAPDQITITAGTPVDIKWTTQNATSSTVCTCNISTGGNCNTSTGNYPLNPFFGGNFSPTTTTIYTVTCQ